MKRVRFLALFAMLVLALSLFLSACGGKGSETTPAPSTPPQAFSDLSDYVIVYPYGADATVFRAIRTLRDAVKAAVGVNLTVREDFVGLGQSVPTDTKEILVGVTNRAESTLHHLRRDDTGIYFENNRLVIAGGDAASTVAAIERYVATYITGGQVLYPTTPDVVRGSYAVESVTLFGTDLSSYVIVRDAANAATAQYMQERIADATGYVLPVIAPRDPARGVHEIVLGRPDGEGRTPPTTPADGKYVIEQAGTRVYLHGGGEDGGYSAMMAFLQKLSGASGTLNLSYATAEIGNATDLSLYTLNLPKGLISAAGVYGVEMTTEAVMERFLLAKEAMPEEVTVLERVTIDSYPLSKKVQVYVSPDGNDKNDGSKDAPFATLKKALDTMNGTNGGIIWMMEGTYTIDEGLILSATVSGTRHSPLFIKAYEGGDVTLTANTTISTDPSLWNYVEASENLGVYERLPESARDEIMYTKLSDHGLTSDDFAEITKAGGPPKLYVGDSIYTLAQYPNETGDIMDRLYFQYVYDTGSVTSTQCMLYWPWIERATAAGKDPKTWIVGWETRIPTGDERGREILTWVNTGDIWYYGSCYSGWEFGYYNIALETEGQGWAHNADGTAWVPGSDETPYLGYPKSDGYYSLKSVQPNSSGAMASGNSAAGRNTYILFNAVEALDAPGEWFLDRDTGILYVYPTEEMEGSKMSTSGSVATTLVHFKYVENLVIDGISVDGANGIGFEFSYCKNVVVQNVESRNTRSSALYFRECYDCAVLYCDFSRANSALVTINASESTRNLIPSGMVVQNCVFHDPLPTEQGGISYAGYRTVISHNYLQNTIISGNVTAECIVEYNLLEGGSSDITDGGMIYTWGWSNRGNHYRYNLIHMFNATHKAIYNDGTSSGHYSYGNIVSFLGSRSSRNLGWYSSTGMGNVCFGNVFILRNPYQVAIANSPDGDEENNILPANAGDMLNESALFYYYFGEEYAGTGSERRYYPVAYDGTKQQTMYLTQSEAGHWWYDMKRDEYNHYTKYNEAGWKETAPAFMNMMYGTQIILAAYDDVDCDYHPKYFYVPWYLTGKTFTYDGLAEGVVVEIPQYAYLDATGKKVVVPAHVAERNDDGSITLTYEELAAMERFRRQPAVCVISDNVILGGTPTTEAGKFTETSDPKLNIVDSAAGFSNYVPTASIENNYFEYLYEEIIYDADNYEYDFLPGALDSIGDILTDEGYALIESIDWTAAGVSYRYPYLSGTR